MSLQEFEMSQEELDALNEMVAEREIERPDDITGLMATHEQRRQSCMCSCGRPHHIQTLMVQYDKDWPTWGLADWAGFIDDFQSTPYLGMCKDEIAYVLTQMSTAVRQLGEKQGRDVDALNTAGCVIPRTGLLAWRRDRDRLLQIYAIANNAGCIFKTARMLTALRQIVRLSGPE